MGRPRAVSSADMTRALDCLAKAGVTADRVEIVIEPGRVRILPISRDVDDSPDTGNMVLPKKW